MEIWHSGRNNITEEGPAHNIAQAFSPTQDIDQLKDLVWSIEAAAPGYVMNLAEQLESRGKVPVLVHGW